LLLKWWADIDGKARAKHPEIWKFFLWTISGILCFFPEMGSYYLCLYALRSLGESFAFMASTAVGYAIGFVINRKATFKADSNVALSIFFYVLTVLFTIFMNGLIGPPIIGLVGRLPLPEALVEAVAKFITMLLPALWFYPANRFLIHRVRKNKHIKENPHD